MRLVVKKLKIFSTHFVHFGRGIGNIKIKLNQMEPQYINNLGNWKPHIQHECYLANIPNKIMKVMAGTSENNIVHYNPRTVPKPPEQLQRLIFHSLSDSRFHSML